MAAETKEAPRAEGKQEGQKKTEPRTLTPYTIFVNEGSPERPQWVEAGTAEGLSDVKAIQSFVAANELSEGTFVAIPTRSFRPRKVAVENKPRVRIG